MNERKVGARFNNAPYYINGSSNCFVSILGAHMQKTTPLALGPFSVESGHVDMRLMQLSCACQAVKQLSQNVAMQEELPAAQ